MDFRVEDVGPCRKRVTITVPPERVKQELDAQYAEVNKQLTLPGFRAGKAPRRLLEGRFGSHVVSDTKQKIVDAAFKRLLEEKRLAPIEQPEVDVNDVPLDATRPFEFGFEVTTRPDFDLPEWKGREVKAPPVVVSDADVELAVERLRLGDGDLVASDDPLATQDVAVLDWVATEGETTVGEAESAYHRLGAKPLEGIDVPDLDARLLGAKPGDAFLLEGRTVASDASTTPPGTAVSVRVTVRETKRFQPAPLDEAFLRRHDFDDLEEMRTSVRRSLRRGLERQRDRLVAERLLDDVAGSVRFDLPPRLVEASLEEWTARRRSAAESEGKDPAAVDAELAAGRDEALAHVEADLRRHFVLERIAEAEQVSVSDQELLLAVEGLARENGVSATDALGAMRAEPRRLAELRAHVKHEKTRDAMRKGATVIDETPAPAS